MRLYLNIFRREPAITKFDWPFTPIHSSSERFSTHNGSVLHAFYTGFNLAMDRSPGFGSTPCDSFALFRLAFATAPPIGLTLPHTTTRWLIMQKARHHPDNIGLPPLVGNGFRYYFTPLTGVLFTFPSRYLFTIGHRHVFSLGRWSSQFRQGFHVSRRTRVPYQEAPNISHTGLSPSMANLSSALLLCMEFMTSRKDCGLFKQGPTTPHWQRPQAYTNKVWAVPLSLAATWGITVVFFSWGY
jgi:hypothetical protein